MTTTLFTLQRNATASQQLKVYAEIGDTDVKYSDGKNVRGADFGYVAGMEVKF